MKQRRADEREGGKEPDETPHGKVFDLIAPTTHFARSARAFANTGIHRPGRRRLERAEPRVSPGLPPIGLRAQLVVRSGPILVDMTVVQVRVRRPSGLALSLVLLLATAGCGQVVDEARAASATVPRAPWITRVTPGIHRIVVTFKAPSNKGRPPITGYRATCFSINGGVTRSTAFARSLTQTVTQLSNGKSYRCKAVARNRFGIGAASARSAAITVPNVPHVPAKPTVASGNAAITVTFNQPVNNGSRIFGYRATCKSSDGGTGGSKTGSVSPLLVTGVSNGKTYTCDVTASNAVGTSLRSPTSAVVVPLDPYLQMGSATNQFGNDPDATSWPISSPPPATYPNFWASITGAGTAKQLGDAFTSDWCDNPGGNLVTDGCSAAGDGKNNDAKPEGYLYAVNFTGAATLDLQAFDPAFVHVGQVCDDGAANLDGRGRAFEHSVVSARPNEHGRHPEALSTREQRECSDRSRVPILHGRREFPRQCRRQRCADDDLSCVQGHGSQPAGCCATGVRTDCVSRVQRRRFHPACGRHDTSRCTGRLRHVLPAVGNVVSGRGRRATSSSCR